MIARRSPSWHLTLHSRLPLSPVLGSCAISRKLPDLDVGPRKDYLSSHDYGFELGTPFEPLASSHIRENKSGPSRRKRARMILPIWRDRSSCAGWAVINEDPSRLPFIPPLCHRLVRRCTINDDSLRSAMSDHQRRRFRPLLRSWTRFRGLSLLSPPKDRGKGMGTTTCRWRVNTTSRRVIQINGYLISRLNGVINHYFTTIRTVSSRPLQMV